MAKIKKRADGRVVKTFTYNGKKYFVYGHDKQEAERKAFQRLQELESGKEDHDNPTLDIFFDRWKSAKALNVKPTTINIHQSKYISCANIIVNGKRFGDYRLSDIKTNDIRVLQNELSNINKSSTVNIKIAFIEQLMNDAEKERYISYNPVRIVQPLKRTEPRCRDNSHRALSTNETIAFFKAFSDSSYYNTCKFALLTGMRIGEIGALRYDDIYDGLIHVNRTITKDDINSLCIGDTTKTIKGKRIIPVNEEIAKVLEKQKQINKILYSDGSNITNMHDLLFKAPKGGLLNGSSVDQAIYRTCDKIGMQRFGVHAFRDTFATRCLENGMQPKVLQELLGHNSFSMTMDLYGHVLNETKIKAMQNIHIAL